MARFLFVAPPMLGHVAGMLAVAPELERRGHETGWLGYDAFLARVLPPGAQRFAMGDEQGTAALVRHAEEARRLAGLVALKYLWQELLVPLARATVAPLERALERWSPDVLVVDHQAFGAAFVARARGVPWATLCTSGAERYQTLSDMPRVLEWTQEILAGPWREVAGDAPLPTAPELSPELVIAFTSRTLFGATDRVPEPIEFVGPAVAARPAVDFPWDALATDRPKVYVSLGSLNAEAGERFYGAVAEALGAEPVQVVVSAPDSFGPFPANFLQRAFVPQVELLRRVDAVVTHAGYNTVLESLVNDLPLVCCPIKDDQMTIAQRVADLGAGVRLSFRRPRPAQLREALRAVLAEPGHRMRAAQLGAELRGAGGAWRVADLLERLARRARRRAGASEEGAA